MRGDVLHNYVRALRKRAGLSQKQLAQLLGNRSGSKVSRYERFRRDPSLDTALACEVVFGTAARNIFAGVHARVEEKTLRRARALVEELRKKRQDATTVRAIDFLQKLCADAEEASARPD